jgi:hypothetical protein
MAPTSREARAAAVREPQPGSPSQPTTGHAERSTPAYRPLGRSDARPGWLVGPVDHHRQTAIDELCRLLNCQCWRCQPLPFGEALPALPPGPAACPPACPHCSWRRAA